MEKLQIREGERLSHAYMIVSPSPAQRDALARDLAAAMLCEGPWPHPCGVCRHCRKVYAGIHPDVTVVERGADEKGAARRSVTVEQVRALVADAQVMPNEAERRVYVIRDADAMNASAQNALLKVLEEPPGGVSFLLCAANAALLLPTVRSRCERLRRNGEAAEDPESAALGGEYLSLCARGDRAALLEWCAAHESLDPRRAEAFVAACREALADVLCGRGEAQLPARRCAELAELLAKCAAYLKQNTGVRHVFGLLAADGIPLPETDTQK